MTNRDNSEYTVYRGRILNDSKSPDMLKLSDMIDLLSHLYHKIIEDMKTSLYDDGIISTFHGKGRMFVRGQNEKMKQVRMDRRLSYYKFGPNPVQAVVNRAYSDFMHMIKTGTLKDYTRESGNSLTLFNFSQKARNYFTSEEVQTKGDVPRSVVQFIIKSGPKLTIEFNKVLQGKPSRMFIRRILPDGSNQWSWGVVLLCVKGCEEDQYPWKNRDLI